MAIKINVKQHSVIIDVYVYALAWFHFSFNVTRSVEFHILLYFDQNVSIVCKLIYPQNSFYLKNFDLKRNKVVYTATGFYLIYTI